MPARESRVEDRNGAPIPVDPILQSFYDYRIAKAKEALEAMFRETKP